MAPETASSWGWRIPFFIGCAIVPLLYMIRRRLEETPEFAARKVHPTTAQIFATLGANWPIVLGGVAMVMMTTVSFYLITVYTPTFGKTVLKLTAADSLIVTICVGISNFIWLPIMGALSDRIGRRPILITFSVLAILTAYPALSWLVAGPTFSKMLIVLLWLSFIYASYNGAMIVALTEVMPFDVRTSGFSLAYSLATTFGGFTAAICTWLIATTGDNASPGYWMSAAAICGLAGTFFVYRMQERPALSGASSGERVIGA
jgi:MHS family citrate/tricarballylate:H+ symporter-like MFS transporter